MSTKIFDENAIERIQRSVKGFEGSPVRLTGRRRDYSYEPPPAAPSYFVRIDGHVTGQSYTGQLISPPFLNFVENPDAEVLDERGPIEVFGASDGQVLVDAEVTELTLEAFTFVDVDGNETWLAQYIRSLPPGGGNGEVLHSDADDVLFWSVPFIVDVDG